MPSESPLSTRERADHVWGRLAFGPGPGDVQALERSGPEGIDRWIERQLKPASISDEKVSRKISSLKALQAAIEKPRLQRGQRPDIEAVRAELHAQKLIRAVESRRQLEQVLVDFWFNHFFVVADYRDLPYFVPRYEEKAIRPRVFGHFRDLLAAVVHSPAMLYYLDNYVNFRGTGPVVAPYGNENYGRELLELHTLGVDGGYTEHDLQQCSSILTGWTFEREKIGAKFVYREQEHQPGPKTVLGRSFGTDPGKLGQREGEELIDLLARHPSTARFISMKLVRRFVCDDPPPSLIKRSAETFEETGGDLRQVYRTIFSSSEFWSRETYKAKFKTPFEYVVSCIRSVGGKLDPESELPQTLSQMTQPLYDAAFPNGVDDTQKVWLDTGSILERIRFAARVASRKVHGESHATGFGERQLALALASPEFQRR